MRKISRKEASRNVFFPLAEYSVDISFFKTQLYTHIRVMPLLWTLVQAQGA